MFITKWDIKRTAAIFFVVQIYLVFLESNCVIFALTTIKDKSSWEGCTT